MHDISESAAPDPRSDSLRERVRRICQTVRYAALAWFAWTTLLTFWVWLHRAEYLDKSLRFHGIDPAGVSELGYWGGFATMIVDLGAVAWLVSTIWRLMQGYIDGQIFTVAASQKLRAVAVAGFLATAVDIVMRIASVALVSTALLAKLPAWRWLDPQHLLYALICGFLLALAAIFKTAAEIVEDNAQIV
jgi:hypothetical protein